MSQNKCCHLVCHMSHPWLFSHAPSSMSTSSSSPAYPTTQREHSAHHAHLQDHLVDKLRHQESHWREDLQSGGTPCITTPTPSNSRCSLMCSSGKSLTKKRFTSLISKCSSGSAASLLCQAHFAHQHPAWHIVNRQQIDLIVMESLEALLKSRDTVRDTLAPFSLELVRGDEHLETFTIFLCGRCCPSSAPTVSVSLRFPLLGMFLAVGDSSWSVIARPTRRAAPFKPPTSRVATGPVDFKVLACFVQADFFLVVAPATGMAVPLRKVHPLILGLRHMSYLYSSWPIGTAGPGSVSVVIVVFQRASLSMSLGFSAGSATIVAHACVRCPGQTSARHMFCEHKIRKLFGQGACRQHSH